MKYVIKGRSMNSILKFEDLRIGEVYRCVDINGKSNNIMYMRIPTCVTVQSIIMSEDSEEENNGMNAINLSTGLLKRHVNDVLVQRYNGIINFKEDYFEKTKDIED